MGYCEGRVTVITGAGGGLGRAYAIRLAKEGAKVVVNDINAETANSCVAEIREAGGEAISNTDDITDYEASKSIVEKTLSEFGDLHAVVNNAGNNRDRMFTSLSEDDWDAVMNVHLKGHFCVSSHATKYWRARHKEGKSVSGRIINTSSGAGLLGSVGQSNYSAAKGGILSLTLVQAAELRRYGVTANAIAPQARTGMTAGVFDDMMKPPEDGSFDVYDPANVAPAIVWFVSEHSSEVTGRCIEIFGGKLSVVDGYRAGRVYEKESQFNPDEFGLNVKKLIDETVAPLPVYGA